MISGFVNHVYPIVIFGPFNTGTLRDGLAGLSFFLGASAKSCGHLILLLFYTLRQGDEEGSASLVLQSQPILGKPGPVHLLE